MIINFETHYKYMQCIEEVFAIGNFYEYAIQDADTFIETVEKAQNHVYDTLDKIGLNRWLESTLYNLKDDFSLVMFVTKIEVDYIEFGENLKSIFNLNTERRITSPPDHFDSESIRRLENLISSIFNRFENIYETSRKYERFKYSLQNRLAEDLGDISEGMKETRKWTALAKYQLFEKIGLFNLEVFKSNEISQTQKSILLSNILGIHQRNAKKYFNRETLPTAATINFVTDYLDSIKKGA